MELAKNWMTLGKLGKKWENWVKVCLLLLETLFSCLCYFSHGLHTSNGHTILFLHLVELKIPHTGNTPPSRTCLIQEYRYYTMSRIRYQYYESMSLPWVLVNTKILSPYHEFMSIPWVHVSTMSPCLYHESLSIPMVLVRNTEMQITEIQTYNLQIYKLKTYKLQKYRNTFYWNTEI